MATELKDVLRLESDCFRSFNRSNKFANVDLELAFWKVVNNNVWISCDRNLMSREKIQHGKQTAIERIDDHFCFAKYIESQTITSSLLMFECIY